MSSSEYKLNATRFQKRIKNLIRFWQSSSHEFSSADCLIIAVGKPEDDLVYQKGLSIQAHLFGYEFPDTFIIITFNKLYVLATKKKCDIILQGNEADLAESRVDIECILLSKQSQAEENKAAFDKFFDILNKFGKVGILGKDKYTGAVYNDLYKPRISALDKEKVEISAGVGIVLSVKDDEEMEKMKMAAKSSSLVFEKYVIDEVARIIDAEEKVKHEVLAAKIEKVLESVKIMGKLGLPSNIEKEQLDFCYTPVIQSSPDYDLKPSAVSNDSYLKAGVILVSLGLRYYNYCSNVGRTMMIDPSKEQQQNYKLLLQLQKHLVTSVIKEGVKIKEVYEAAVSWLKGQGREDLVECLPKNLGFVTGLEYRDGGLVLSAKNESELIKDMTLNLILGFQNVKEKNETYALLVADIVVVGKDEGNSLIITDAGKEMNDVAFFFKDEGDENSPASASSPAVKKDKGKSSLDDIGVKKSAILKTRLRNESKAEEDLMNATKRKEHQRELLEDLVKEGMKKYADVGNGEDKEEDDKKIFRKYESYRSAVQVPQAVVKNCIYVDKKQETVILPVFGMSVPFHLNSLKNISKNDEGDYTYLRLNFNTPGQANVKKDEILPYDDPDATFVRSFTFRSADRQRYAEIYKQITDLKREMQKKENERRLRSDLVEQDRLVESKRPVAVLQDVSIRPALEGKRLPGDLQIHSNGLRFQPVRGDQKLDVLFGNIKHLFFQPCDNELYVILHCHLKNPIMVGKKKTKDVQFYRDASESGFDETNNKRRRRAFGDEDELMAEQEERKRRARLNKDFKTFAEKIAEVSDIYADIPQRELGFHAAVASNNVMFKPTEACLVQLSETPFTVVELDQVELANLERVQFSSKYFDLVFVFKDFTKTPVHLNAISMKQLDAIKEWLDFANIFYMESPVALSWPAVLKNIQADPLGFYEDGGWSTLVAEEDEQGGSDSEDSASEYEASESEEEESESESEFSEEDEEEEEEESEEDYSGEEDSEEEEERPKKSSKHSSSVKRSHEDDDLRPKKKHK